MGAAVLGIVAGALGSLPPLRRQSLLGDAMSHAALPGVLLAFMLTGSRLLSCWCWARPWPASGHLSAAGHHPLQPREGRCRPGRDPVGLLRLRSGAADLSTTQPDGGPGGTELLPFQAATLLTRDVVVMAAFGGAALLLLAPVLEKSSNCSASTATSGPAWLPYDRHWTCC